MKVNGDFTRAVTVERQRQSLTEMCLKDNGKKENKRSEESTAFAKNWIVSGEK